VRGTYLHHSGDVHRSTPSLSAHELGEETILVPSGACQIPALPGKSPRPHLFHRENDLAVFIWPSKIDAEKLVGTARVLHRVSDTTWPI